MARDDLADEHGRGRGERIFGPLLIHSPLASVPSLAHTRHIWHRFPPTLILNRFCDAEILLCESNSLVSYEESFNGQSLFAVPRIHCNLCWTEVSQPHSRPPFFPRPTVWTLFQVLVLGWQWALVLHQVAKRARRLSPAAPLSPRELARGLNRTTSIAERCNGVV